MIDSITLLRAQEAGLPAAESHPDQPLVCFPMRFEWEIAQGRLIQRCTQRNCTVCAGPPRVTDRDMAWPAPMVDSHPVEPDFMGKRAVVDMVALATAHGWHHEVTHAQGSYPSLGRHPGPPMHSLAVRLWRGAERAVAVYVEAASGWEWKTLYRWDIGARPHAVLGVEAFLTAISGPLCKPVWPTDWTCPSFGPLHGPKRPPRR